MKTVPAVGPAFAAEPTTSVSKIDKTGTLPDGNRQLELISENFPDGALYQYVVTPAGQHLLTYLGRGFERIFGGRPAELPADAAWLAMRIHPADRPGIDEAGDRSRLALTPFNFEVRINNAA